MYFQFILLVLGAVLADEIDDHHTVSRVDSNKYSVEKEKKFLLYDVNFGEGFNLRRDVYMRIANTVRLLRESGENYILVLPPWGRLHHWMRMEVALSWRLFFDLQSLNRFVPVIEFEDFLDETENHPIDQVIYLQHYEEGWGTEYVRKFDERKCLSPAYSHYKQDETGKWKGWFYSYEDVRARNFKCVSIQGDSGTLRNLLKISNYTSMNTVMIDRGETILHENFGDVHYWNARRSMRYSNDLVEIGNSFRRKYLDSDDERDKTEMVSDWKKERARRNALGGPYVGVHWRRRDFLFTDNQKFNDGQIAIIDQYLCAHARHFIGSHESTFSFRIQEDREIIGFPIASTFNRLCPDKNPNCEQPSKWKIVY
uniref:GDP-fucose protein O-fucosyltransferase 2 n=1 Tax=Caenorhabditis tropicalis TaxID=1561998 RepID=A0A1I7TMJ6_9PELO